MKTLSLASLFLILVSFSIFTVKPAKVKIIVVDENSNLVEGANVSLYINQERYKTEKNASASGKTNSKGIIQFKNLEERIYYIHVRKGDLNNNGGSIQTDTLHASSKNRFQIMID